MTAKELALQDIKDELEKQNKTFIPFIESLNRPMRRICHSYLKRQGYKMPSSSRGQLIAHCFFMNSEVKYENYSKYYEK